MKCPAPRQQVVLIVAQRFEFWKGFIFQMQLVGPHGGYPSNALYSLIFLQRAVEFCWFRF
eukprot:scaffold353_cov185-Amphora_coffeaeformis.AAC.49